MIVIRKSKIKKFTKTTSSTTTLFFFRFVRRFRSMFFARTSISHIFDRAKNFRNIRLKSDQSHVFNCVIRMRYHVYHCFYAFHSFDFLHFVLNFREFFQKHFVIN